MTALAALLLAPAWAYTVQENADGTAMAWDHMPITWALDPTDVPDGLDPDAVAAAIAASASTWATVADSDVAFAEVDLDEAEGVVRFVDPWPHDPELAAANVNTVVDGVIVGFTLDLRLDAASWSTAGDPDALDVRNAVTHELGHALGLDHVDIPEATMEGTLAVGDVSKRDLYWDDEDGARALYLRGSLTAEPIDSPAGCAAPVGATGWLAWMAAAALTRRRAGTRRA